MGDNCVTADERETNNYLRNVSNNTVLSDIETQPTHLPTESYIGYVSPTHAKYLARRAEYEKKGNLTEEGFANEQRLFSKSSKTDLG